MNLISKQKLLLMTLKRPIGVGFGGQLQQVRRLGPISGPPRHPLSMAQRAIYGWGSLLFMMIIPVWTLYQLPHWSALHNNQPWEEDEPKVPKEEE